MRRIKHFISFGFCLFTGAILIGQEADTLLLSADSLSVQESVSDTVLAKDVDSSLVIVFAGDIMGHDAQINGAYIDSSGTYDYEPTFRYVSDYLKAADLAIGNLEVTLAGPPYKGYPQFSSPDALAIEAQKAGFDVFVTANNHALDRGYKGMERTKRVLDSLGIVHAGIYMDSTDRDARYPLIVEKKGVRLALLNYTYGTNGLKVKPPYIINRIDRAQIKADVEKAESVDPDYIVCVIHWGKEYERDENVKQQEMARFILDCGVDAIIGSHPHVVQPIKLLGCGNDTIRKCPVVYSMGNFVSNQRAQYKDGGIMAELHLSKKKGVVEFDSISYMPYWVYREPVAEEKYTFYVLPVPFYEEDSSLVNLSDNDLWRFNRFTNDTRKHLEDANESVFFKKQD